MAGYQFCCAARHSWLNKSLDLKIHIVADVYITPHIFHAAPQKLSESIAVLIQGFCQEMVLPHLHEFTKLCDIESIGPIPPSCTFYFFLDI